MIRISSVEKDTLTRGRSSHTRWSPVSWGLALLVVMVGALLTPDTAAASTYVWRVDADGTWTNPANWSHVAGSGPLGPGYPTARADVAKFGDGFAFTATRVITIPNDVFITVGIIHFRSQFGFVIRGGGANCRLELDNGAAPARIERFVVPNGADSITVPIRLLGRLQIENTPQESSLVLAGAIGEAGGVWSITKYGRGFLYLASAGNSYTGATTVEDGQLGLDGNAGPTVLGDLVIGDGVLDNGTPHVIVQRSEQVADFARVRVNADGRLSVLAVERIATVIVNGGTVSIESGSTVAPIGILSVGSLAMTGGLLQSAGGGQLRLEGTVVATSNASGPAVIRLADAGNGGIDLGGATRTFLVTQGLSPQWDLEISLPIRPAGTAGVTKDGAGRLRFTGARSNTYAGVTLVHEGRLELAKDSNAIAVPGALQVGESVVPAVVELIGAGVSNRHNIADSALVAVSDRGVLLLNSDEGFDGLSIGPGARVEVGVGARAGVYMSNLSVVAGRLTIGGSGGVIVHGDLLATSTNGRHAVIEGAGALSIRENHSMDVLDGPEAIDLVIDAPLSNDGAEPFTKRGAGLASIARVDSASPFTVAAGTMLVTGAAARSAFTLAGGTLGGGGTLGVVTGSTGRLAPGVGIGRLRTGAVALSASSTLVIELVGSSPAAGYDQLAVSGSVSLGNARLELAAAATLPAISTIVVIDNDATDAVNGTFLGLAEGATVRAGGRDFTLTYRGGDGNDVVLTDPNAEVTYFLAEGATGTFFDDDVLIANPTTTDAPVTLTFLLEGGRRIVEHRTVRARARLTVHVDEIPGLEATSASVQVTSDARVPLVVERTMFWDQSYYGGHTANAVAQPETRSIFAEGFQGFFDTFILIANANAEATTATLTFLREGAAPVVKTVPVAAFARKTVYAGDYPELVGRAFGIVVEAPQPVIAERAMYFGSQPGRTWAGGHANTGIVAPATSWFHAEGATGSYFSTFILLSNPGDVPASVQVRFLLSTGDVITRQKTLPARARLTINPATEGDARLENAAVSTVVESDVPIVSERSMYWPGEATPYGEGHNSSGVDSLATRWGLAEGRVGGPHGFDTYILLANPGSQAAQVTITYLRESGAPVVKTYTVPPTSRYNVDVKSVAPELEDSSFGARVESTNGVPIAVERSLYWNAAGVFWAGGTNALATPLP